MKGAKRTLLKNAVTVAVGGFFAKVLGAVYRIPLGNLLGGYGLGLYQMVFPLYAMLLTLSATSVPSALSKLIAESGEEERAKLMQATRVLLPVGGVFSLLLAALSGVLARLQGNADAQYAYLLLSPSVFFVSAFAAYRGFFQGEEKMLPTVISQIIEQGAKLIFGLAFAKAFLPNVPLAAAGACLGVTVSEALALLYLKTKYAKRKRKVCFLPGEGRTYRRRVLSSVFPMMLIGILPPLTNLITGFFTIPLLSKTTPFATQEYGIFFGGVTSVIAMPVALCYGVAVALIPALSRRKTGKEPLSQNPQTAAYFYTLLLALPATLGIWVFRGEIAAVLFPALTLGEQALAARLLGATAPSVLLLSLGQTASAALIAKGKAKRSALHYAAGCLVSVTLSFLLLWRGFGIISLAFSTIFGDFVASFLNLLYSRERNEKRAHAYLLAVFITAFALLSAYLGRRASVGGAAVRVLTGGTVMMLCYLLFFAALFLFIREKRRKNRESYADRHGE